MTVEDVYQYTDVDGTPVFRVVRKIQANGKKAFIQSHDIEQDGKIVTINSLPDEMKKPSSRPLFLAAEVFSADHVVIVEGEKAAKAGQALYGDKFQFTTWSGGTNAWAYTDYAILTGKKVTLIPDYDQPGQTAMAALRKHLSDFTETARLFLPWQDFPASRFPEKWDIADHMPPGVTEETFLEKLQAVHSAQESYLSPVIPQSAHGGGNVISFTPTQQNNYDVADGYDVAKRPYSEQNYDAYFNVLGYDEGNLFFLPIQTKQIMKMPPEKLLRPAGILMLHPDKALWNRVTTEACGMKQKSPDWESIGADLIRRCQMQGIYRIPAPRGMGLWREDGRVAAHMGKFVWFDGKQHDPASFSRRNHYIYQEPPYGYVFSQKEYSFDSGMALAQACQTPYWEHAASGDLLAGWIVASMVCGALSWRPHLLLEGLAESGKTAVIGDIAFRAFGRGAFCRSLGVGNTVAGVRRTMKDSVAILIDEFEREEDDRLIRDFFKIFRMSSSDSGASTVRCAEDGKVDMTELRSTFLLSAISARMSSEADVSRFTKLGLRSAGYGTNKALGVYKDAERKKIISRIPDDFGQCMFTYLVKNIDPFLDCIEVFKIAVMKATGGVRFKDQMGTLLAGRWALTNPLQVTEQEADDWVGQVPMDLYLAERNRLAGKRVILDMLLSYRVDMEVGSGRYNRALGQLCSYLAADGYERESIKQVLPTGCTEANIISALYSAGLSSDDKGLYIPIDGGKNIFTKTSFEESWHRVLRAAYGAEVCRTTERGNEFIMKEIFGKKRKCLHIPYALMFGSMDTDATPAQAAEIMENWSRSPFTPKE